MIRDILLQADNSKNAVVDPIMHLATTKSGRLPAMASSVSSAGSIGA